MYPYHYYHLLFFLFFKRKDRGVCERAWMLFYYASIEESLVGWMQLKGNVLWLCVLLTRRNNYRRFDYVIAGERFYGHRAYFSIYWKWYVLVVFADVMELIEYCTLDNLFLIVSTYFWLIDRWFLIIGRFIWFASVIEQLLFDFIFLVYEIFCLYSCKINKNRFNSTCIEFQ